MFARGARREEIIDVWWLDELEVEEKEQGWKEGEDRRSEEVGEDLAPDLAISSMSSSPKGPRSWFRPRDRRECLNYFVRVLKGLYRDFKRHS